MGCLARRLNDETAKIEVARQFSRRDPLLEHGGDTRLELGENVHGTWLCRGLGAASARLYRNSRAPSKRRACSAIANRSVMPAI
jgi:hypothetical protein